MALCVTIYKYPSNETIFCCGDITTANERAKHTHSYEWCVCVYATATTMNGMVNMEANFVYFFAVYPSKRVLMRSLALDFDELPDINL